MSKNLLGVLALLGSSVVSAATVTVTPSAPNNLVNGAYFLTVGSADMPATTGLTIGLTYNASVVSITNAAFLAPFSFAVWTPTGVGTGLISVTNTSIPGIAGPFNVFNLNFSAIGDGNANFVFFDTAPNGDLGWVQEDESLIGGVVYQNPNVVVNNIPVPAAAWLFVSAIGGLATLKRRQAR